MIKTGERVEKKVFPLTKGGYRVPTLTHVAPIRNDAGQIIGAVEAFRDITKDEDLRLLQEKFQKLISKYVSTSTFEEALARAQGDDTGDASLQDLTVLYLDVVGFTSFFGAQTHRPKWSPC